MSRRVIVDAGPLVALIDVSDTHHAWAKAELRNVSAPLHTCESALSEACHLLRRVHGGPDTLMRFLTEGHLAASFAVTAEATALRGLMARYAEVPMSLADACLVRMSELDRGATVLTIDGDFLIYRRGRREKIRVRMP